MNYIIYDEDMGYVGWGWRAATFEDAQIFDSLDAAKDACVRRENLMDEPPKATILPIDRRVISQLIHTNAVTVEQQRLKEKNEALEEEKYAMKVRIDELEYEVAQLRDVIISTEVSEGFRELERMYDEVYEDKANLEERVEMMDEDIQGLLESLDSLQNIEFDYEVLAQEAAKLLVEKAKLRVDLELERGYYHWSRKPEGY